MPTFGSLFAGIGGIDLGLERAGWRCIWQVEIDPFRRAILEKHWPDVPKHGAIEEVDLEQLEVPDLIAGGFPCQPVSDHGRRDGTEGGRWLWPYMARCVQALRPRFVLVENIVALRRRGLSDVLSDLHACGYDAEWDDIAASEFGAPHRRARLFLIAYPSGQRWWASGVFDRPHEVPRDLLWDAAEGVSEWEGWKHWLVQGVRRGDWQEAPAAPGSMDDGVPGRLDRIRALGDAVVPQVAEYIGRRILETTAVLQ